MRLFLAHSCSNLMSPVVLADSKLLLLRNTPWDRHFHRIEEDVKEVRPLNRCTTLYNWQRKEMAGQLSHQEEARMLLQHLEGKNVHVAIDEEYILDTAGNRIDRVIRCIAWWTQEQIRQARRFVSDMVAETDATFNTNTKRLLL